MVHNWTNRLTSKISPRKMQTPTCIDTSSRIPSRTRTTPSTHGTTYQSRKRHLGVTFDEQLTFKHHFNEKRNKANSTVGIIRRTLDYFMYLLCDLISNMPTRYGPHISRNTQETYHSNRKCTASCHQTSTLVITPFTCPESTNTHVI